MNFITFLEVLIIILILFAIIKVYQDDRFEKSIRKKELDLEFKKLEKEEEK